VSNKEKWLYHKLRETCLAPFERRAKYYEDYATDEEDQNEIREVVACTTKFLDDYAKMSVGAMDDYDLDKFYKRTVEMLKTAIETKKEQYERAFDRLQEIKEDLEEQKELYCVKDSTFYDEHLCEVTLEKLDNVESFRKQLEQAKAEDVPTMEAQLKVCEVAKDRKEKVICIDSVANMVHTRGAILPLMCGAPLSEFIDEAVFGEDVEGYERPVEVVAVDMAKDTMDTLTCIRNFKGI